MLPTLFNVFMTASRMDGFSYVEPRARRSAPGRSSLEWLRRALLLPERDATHTTLRD